MISVKHNLCSLDRIIRGIISVALTAYVFMYYEQIGDLILQILILIVAFMNFISFAFGWCPVYKLANINTCKKE